MNHIVKGIILIILGGVIAALLVFSLIRPPFAVEADDIAWGATFSHKMAQALGLDWQEAYLAVLDDLQLRRIRLPVYWDQVESQPGARDFSVVDWQLQRAEERGIDVVLTVGQRVPRWPECHIPVWAESLSYNDRHRRIMAFLEDVVVRYRDSSAVRWWQVENEPFLAHFGECPPMNAEHLDAEIALVRSLDDRPILISDSGELSVWIPAARRANVFGTTMYKVVWNKFVGEFHYPITPQFFWLKTNIVRLFSNPQPERFVVIELQAEPWLPKQIYEVSVDQHFKSMPFGQFRENIRFAQQVGFPEVYLWGVEWHYWLKETEGDSRFWEYVKGVVARQAQ